MYCLGRLAEKNDDRPTDAALSTHIGLPTANSCVWG